MAVKPGAVTVYVNGTVAINLTGLTGSPIVDNGPLRIGSRNISYITNVRPQDRFNGRIDEFSFYGRALTGAEIASVYQAGGAGKCVQPIAPSIVVAPVNQTVLAGKDVTFSVVAAGTGPLAYQWQFNDANIANATNATLVVTAPRKAAAGKYSVTVSNSAGSAPVVSATLAVTPAPTLVRIVNSAAKSPQTVEVPVILVGNAVENAVSFSLRFDTNRLTYLDANLGADAANGQLLINSAQASKGVLGIILALPSGGTFADGTNNVLNLTFGTALVANDTTAQFSYSDAPTVRKVADATGKSLTATFTTGFVAITATDFEGDLSPLPNGDKQVDISDWVQVGRFVAGLDDIATPSQFQRADSAPLATSGNGLLTVSDWVQAGRFAVGLDPLVPAGGPTVPSGVGPGRNKPKLQGDANRIITIAAGPLVFGKTNEVSVMVAAQGDENALAFSLNFDPARITFLSASKGSQITGGDFFVNGKQAASGRLGVAVTLSSSKQLAAGSREIAKLRFVVAGGGSNSTNLTFGDTPVIREVANALAEALPSTWQSAALVVVLPTVSVSRIQTPDGAAVAISWSAQFADAVLESAGQPDAATWTPVTTAPILKDGNNTVSVPLNDTAGYFRLRLP